MSDTARDADADLARYAELREAARRADSWHAACDLTDFTDAVFPDWVKRAVAAEAECERLKAEAAELQRQCDWWYDHDKGLN